MNKKLFSKIIMLALFAGTFGVLHNAYALPFAAPETTTHVGNVSPVITQVPSDGGSNDRLTGTANTKGNPTNVGSLITFTAKAFDINSDPYYLAVCKTNSITANDGAAPTCATVGNTWAISASTASNVAASVTYTAVSGDAESNDWYAFVCDDVSGDSACYPANGHGDKGYSEGTVAFASTPADATNVIIDGKTFQFDTTDGAHCTGSPDVCMDAHLVEDGAMAAALLAGAAPTANFSMVARGAVTYIYATAEGAGGNAITLAKSGDTVSVVTLSGAHLANGDDDNASPFFVNHRPTFSDVVINDGTSSIQPGETVNFHATVADQDSTGSQDTIDFVVCSGEADQGGVTTAFVPGQTITDASCSGGHLLCKAENQAPGAVSCADTTDMVSIPTAHATDYTVMIYVQDNHSFADEAATHNFDYAVTDVAPQVLSYNVTQSIGSPDGTIVAGGSAPFTFSAVINDDNGAYDVTGVDGVFYDDTAINLSSGTCTGSENNCYVISSCVVSGQGATGTGKTATGATNPPHYTATCAISSEIWFNADASDQWKAHVNPADSGATVTNSIDSAAKTISPSTGIEVSNTLSIAYATVAIGGTSAGQETSIGNMGNQPIDVKISGTDMLDGNEDSINKAYQKWDNISNSFSWDAPAADPGPWALVDSETSSGGTDEANGCINKNIAVRSSHITDGSTPWNETNKSIFWKIRIPAGQQSGSYTGTNTFASAVHGVCSDAASH